MPHTTFARPKVLDGRLPRRDRANEVMINPVLADRERLSVGDRVTALGFSREATESTEDPTAAEAGSLEEQIAAGERAGLVERFDLEVSGIGISPEEIVVDEAFEGPAMLLSPAFGPAHPDVDAGYFGIEARVRGQERGSRRSDERSRRWSPARRSRSRRRRTRWPRSNERSSPKWAP